MITPPPPCAAGRAPRSGFYCIYGPTSGISQPLAVTPPHFSPAPLGPGSSIWGADTAWHDDGRRSIAFHGELYNEAGLRAELGVDPDFPLGRLLLLAHERWPRDFARRLDGLFVLAMREGNSFRLYRDVSGARNLYYTAMPGGGLAMSTDLDILLHLPGVQRLISRRSLHEYLRFLDISAPETLYEGIRALEAGVRLTWSGGQFHEERLDHLPAAETGQPSFDEAVDTVEALLRQSVRRRLADASRPASFLSGGVDSSLICALAADPELKLTAVTVGFEGSNYDETPIAQQVAAHLGIRHQVFRYTRSSFIQAFEDFLHGAEQPFADPALPPTLLVFRDCQVRFDVVLDGSGADEATGLLPPRHIRVATEYAVLLPRLLRRAVAGTLRRLPQPVSGYAPIFDFEHPAELTTRWRGFSRQEIEELAGEAVSFDHTRFFRTFAEFPRTAHFDRYTALLDVMPGDRMHQGYLLTGLCLRFPFWDRATDEYLRALPVEYRYQPGMPKRILRAVLARHVPRAIWDVPKHGFDFPLHSFLTAEDFRLVRRYLLESDWKHWQILAPEAVAGYARRFMAGEPGLTFRVWALAVLAAWLEGHGY